MSKEQHKVLDFTLELPWEQFHFSSYFSETTKLETSSEEASDSTLSACSTTVQNGLGHSSIMTEDAKVPLETKEKVARFRESLEEYRLHRVCEKNKLNLI